MAELGEVKLGKLDPGAVTMTVKVDVRELRVRMAIGIWLIKLGARAIRSGCERGAAGDEVIPAQGKLWDGDPLDVRVMTALRLSGAGLSAGDLAWLFGQPVDDVLAALLFLAVQGLVEETDQIWRAVR